MLLSYSIVSSSCAINSFFFLLFQCFVLHHSIFLLLTRHFPQCIFHRHLLYYHHLLLLLLHLSDIHLFFFNLFVVLDIFIFVVIIVDYFLKCICVIQNIHYQIIYVKIFVHFINYCFI